MTDDEDNPTPIQAHSDAQIKLLTTGRPSMPYPMVLMMVSEMTGEIIELEDALKADGHEELGTAIATMMNMRLLRRVYQAMHHLGVSAGLLEADLRLLVSLAESDIAVSKAARRGKGDPPPVQSPAGSPSPSPLPIKE